MAIPANCEHLPVTRLMVRQRLADLGISSNYTDTDIDNALATINQDAEFDAERAKLTVEVWDKQSPINGVSAATVLERRKDIPENGEVYLIKEGERILYFQPHAPGVGGMMPMTTDNVLSYANQHADEVAAIRAAARIIDAAITALGA